MKHKPKTSAVRRSGKPEPEPEPEPVIDRAEQEAWEDREFVPDMTESGRRWFLEQRRERKSRNEN